MSKRHIVIAGTGRAGTSFLVKFLGECGFETALEEGGWAERARAGGESRLDADGALPHVVKDPWLWTYCRNLDLEEVGVELLIVPVRELMSAAASRVLQERAAIAGTSAASREGLDVFAWTSAGVVFSLSTVDQARILAVGFHELLQWAISNDIRVVLLDFPRIVEDGEYLVNALWPVLESRVDRQVALAAFAEVADPSALRIRRQMGRDAISRNLMSDADAELGLDRAGLVMRIGELETHAANVSERFAAVESELADARAHGLSADRQVALLQAELANRAIRHGRIARLRRAIRRNLGRR